MKPCLLIALVIASGHLLDAQEREPPKDSSRITMRGCAKGRVFIVGPRSEREPVRSDVSPGRRFLLSGPRTLLSDIKVRERTMVEVTGLVRKSQLSGPGGISIAGGRIRIGGAAPQDPTRSGPGRDPAADQAVIDVESWRSLPDSCPAR